MPTPRPIPELRERLRGVYKTRKQPDNLIPVYIDKRTTIMVKPGTDITAIRSKYDYLKLKS